MKSWIVFSHGIVAKFIAAAEFVQGCRGPF